MLFVDLPFKSPDPLPPCPSLLKRGLAWDATDWNPSWDCGHLWPAKTGPGHPGRVPGLGPLPGQLEVTRARAISGRAAIFLTFPLILVVAEDLISGRGLEA